MPVRKWNEVYERLHSAGPALAGAASTTTAGRNVVNENDERVGGADPQPVHVAPVIEPATSAPQAPVPAHGARHTGRVGRCRARAESGSDCAAAISTGASARPR